MNSKELGAFGEKIASDYLEKKGYKILDKNYSFRIPGNPQKGEIDIVSQKKDIISFVEVKTQRGLVSLIRPEEKVNFQKQRKLIKTAQVWLSKNRIPLNSKWQIDVLAINLDLNSKKAKIRHFKNVLED